MSKDKDKEFIDDWMSKIKAGIEYRRKYSTIERWKDFRKMYRGQWDPEIVPVNKVFSYGRSMVPRVYFKAPRVSITAPNQNLIEHAKVVESIDNWLIDETKLKNTLKLAILDSFLCGIGIIKLGYDSEFGYLPTQATAEDGGTVTQVSTKDGDKIEYNETIKPGMPWAIRCRPEDIVVPWGSTSLADLPWIAHYILRPLDDVKQDQKYKHTKDLEGSRTPSMDMSATAPFRPTREKDRDVTYAELWEIRDYRSGQIYVICEDKLLLSEDDVLQVEGLPYEFIVFNPDPEHFWPIPDAHILEPQQKEINSISTQTSKHVGISLLKFLYSEGKLSEEELEKFLSGNVGVAVAVKDTENLAGAIMTLQPHVPPELYTAMASTTGMMKESLGFSSNELGDYQQGSPRSATETMTVAESFEQRISERRDIVADVLTGIVRKWNQFVFQFWMEERVARIITIEGEAAWVPYTGDQLRGEYSLRVDADSGMPITRAVKYQMGQDLMRSFGGDQLIDQMLLRKIVLDNYALVDPRVNELLSNQLPPGVPPAASAAVRQPSPLGAGQGTGGGRQGSSIGKSNEFDASRQRFENVKGNQ